MISQMVPRCSETFKLQIFEQLSTLYTAEHNNVSVILIRCERLD